MTFFLSGGACADKRTKDVYITYLASLILTEAQTAGGDLQRHMEALSFSELKACRHVLPSQSGTAT